MLRVHNYDRFTGRTTISYEYSANEQAFIDFFKKAGIEITEVHDVLSWPDRLPAFVFKADGVQMEIMYKTNLGVVNFEDCLQSVCELLCAYNIPKP